MKQSSKKKSSSRKKGASRKKGSTARAGKVPGKGKARARADAKAAETKIVVLACKWHPLESMENAVTDGFTYDPGIVVLPVRCTGGITMASILKLFARELEGVLILGCGEGDCHYFNGSERCGEIVRDAREILEWSGIAPERLGFALMSGSEGSKFVDALEAYKKDLKGAGSRRKRRVT